MRLPDDVAGAPRTAVRGLRAGDSIRHRPLGARATPRERRGTGLRDPDDPRSRRPTRLGLDRCRHAFGHSLRRLGHGHHAISRRQASRALDRQRERPSGPRAPPRRDRPRRVLPRRRVLDRSARETRANTRGAAEQRPVAGSVARLQKSISPFAGRATESNRTPAATSEPLLGSARRRSSRASKDFSRHRFGSCTAALRGPVPFDPGANLSPLVQDPRDALVPLHGNLGAWGCA